MQGTVIRNTGSDYTVRTRSGEEMACKIKGNFRIKGIRTTNPVAVGDVVTVSRTSEDAPAYITAIAPRKNYIIRRASNLSKETHIIAANIDATALVVTLCHPVTSTTFIDRFLATAEAYAVTPLLVINKTDLLAEDPELGDYLDAVTNLYTSIGYQVIPASAMTGQGLDTLRAFLAGKTTLFSGNSGVGKTSLINALIPGLHLRTAPVSATHDTGTHTTTFSQMFTLPYPGGEIIDTPGIKSFGTVEMTPAETGHYFPEIFSASRSCRYSDCTHTHEPGCAVLEALADHRISQSRYTSYLSILNDIDPAKYRLPQ